VERLGVALEFSDQQIGSSMLIASLAGIPGAFSIVMLGTRFGRLAGLSFGFAVSIVGLIVMINAQTFLPYVIGSMMISFAWAFCLPYIQGLMASLDPNGSAVAAGSATSTIGGAIGPGLAALVIGSGVYQHIFMFAIGMLLFSLMSFFVSGRHAARS
jgi:MFS family permease